MVTDHNLISCFRWRREGGGGRREEGEGDFLSLVFLLRAWLMFPRNPRVCLFLVCMHGCCNQDDDVTVLDYV